MAKDIKEFKADYQKDIKEDEFVSEKIAGINDITISTAISIE